VSVCPYASIRLPWLVQACSKIRQSEQFCFFFLSFTTYILLCMCVIMGFSHFRKDFSISLSIFTEKVTGIWQGLSGTWVSLWGALTAQQSVFWPTNCDLLQSIQAFSIFWQCFVVFHLQVLCFYSFFLSFCFFLLAVLGFELKALHLLGRHLPLKPHPLSCFSYFSGGVSHFCLDRSGPQFDLCFPHSWDKRHMPPCPAFFVDMGFCFLPRLALNLDPPDLYLLSS
jgi:hypothetical protein